MLKKLLVAGLMLFSLHTFAQDPVLTQYHSVPSYLNPGFTGSNGCGRASAAYRNQWPVIPGQYITSLISYEHYLHKLRGGLGLNYMHDIAGEGLLTGNRLELTYAPHIELMKKKLIVRPGIGVAWGRKKADWSNLTFGDMIDPRRGFVYTTVEPGGRSHRDYFDLSAGMVASTKYVYGGVAVHHINQPDEGIIGKSKLPARYTVHVAGMIGEPGTARRFCISPHVMYMQQQDFSQFAGGVTAKYDKFILGVAYRHEDAAIVQAAFQNELFRVGYSYDHTISRLTTATGGSHELTTSFNIMYKKEKKVKPVRTIAF